MNMPPSEMTPYLIAKKCCMIIKKKHNQNTFENILGANNIFKQKKAVYYLDRNKDFGAAALNNKNPLQKKSFRVQHSTPNLRAAVKESTKNVRQSYGEQVVSSTSKISGQSLSNKNRYNSVWKQEEHGLTQSANRCSRRYGGNSKSIQETKAFIKNRNRFYGIFDENDIAQMLVCQDVKNIQKPNGDILTEIKDNLNFNNDLNYTEFNTNRACNKEKDDQVNLEESDLIQNIDS